LHKQDKIIEDTESIIISKVKADIKIAVFKNLEVKECSMKVEIDLLICDDKIKSHDKYFNGDILDVDLKGGGGTDFRPVFEFIENELQDTKLLLYFTDLDGIFPIDEVNYEVKWVTSRDADTPFGDILFLES